MKKLIATAGLFLMLGCSPGSTSTAEGPGVEATSETSPAPEGTATPTDGGRSTDGGKNEDHGISVDLPGLPIGGNEVVFSPDAPTQCVSVNVTGFALPDGVGIEFTKIKVPEPQFTVDSSPCSDSPCVRASQPIKADSGCTVSITWRNEPVDAGRRYALRANAKAFCTSRPACAEVKAAVDAANEQNGGPFAIGLIITPPAEESPTPAEGESTPADGSSTPADGASGGSSPSVDSSGG